MMIAGAGFLVGVPSPALAYATSGGPAKTCLPCPGNPTYCEPNCPVPKCNPNTFTVSVTDLEMTNHSTNVTVTWQESPNFSNTSNVFNWGNTTNYGFSLGPSYNGVTYTVFLDFLEPQTVYDFQIYIQPSYHSCTTEYVASAYYNTFTTLSENVYFTQYANEVQGIIFNAAGGRAPAGISVYLWCTGTSVLLNNTVTNSNGRYVMYPDIGPNGCTAFGKGYYVVQVYNVPNSGPPGINSINWPGHWNETVVIWASQFVNFYLPSNIIGPWIPQVVDYSNAPLGYSQISFSTTTTFANSVVDEFGASGGAYVGGAGGGISYQTSTTASQTFITTSSDISYNGSLEVLERFWTSGVVEFNALNRTLTLPVETPYGSEVYKEQGPQYVAFTDAGMYPITNYQHVELAAHQSEGYGVSVSGSTTESTNFSMSLEILVPLEGVTFSLGVNLAWEASVSQSYSNDLVGQIGSSTTTQAECYDIFGEGGSQSGGTATAISIWMYSPSSGGTPCPY